MQILPPRRSVYGLHAPRVATVGRLGALGAVGDISWTQDPSTGVYTVTDPATSYSVTVTAGAMDAGLATGDTPSAITSDGGLLWSDPSAFAAYYGAATGLDITNPYSIPGYIPGWATGAPGAGGTQMLPPGVTPADDIAFDAGSGGDVGDAGSTEARVAQVIANLEERVSEAEKARIRAEADKAKADESFGKTLLKYLAGALTGGGLLWGAKLLLASILADKIKSGEALPQQCANFIDSMSTDAALSCATCLLTRLCPPQGSAGSVSSDSCSTAGVAKATADINAAKTAAQVNTVVAAVEASCGKDSAAADLIRKTGAAKRTKLTVGTVALWGGLGLGVALIFFAVARNRRQ